MNISLIHACALGLAALGRTATTQDLTPRQPMAAPDLLVTDASSALLGQRIVVKFRDEWLMRSTSNGQLVSRANRGAAAAHSAALELGLRFRPLIQVTDERLTELTNRAAARSRRAQPDLAGFLIADSESEEDLDQLATCLQLQALDCVEYAYLQSLAVPPPSNDLAPPTPDFTDSQGYFQPDPGMDVDYAWSRNIRGAGVRLSDCEYGWIATHEDLCPIDLHLEPGQTPSSQVAQLGWDEHGTAVVGSTSGAINEYGVDGMAPESEVYTYPEWTIQGGVRRVTAIANAIADSSFGDVVMLEMQAPGPDGAFGPAEFDPAVWTVTRTGTDAGVVVVGAAGNGGADLDSATHAVYASWGDSGAIIVGAGSPTSDHAPEFFTTHGSRVNVHGWGSQVYSLGYGSATTIGGDINQQYSWFSGTSSATPLVAAACLLAQSHAIDVLGSPLPPEALRQFLMDTGTAQGQSPFGSKHIGPLPDLRALIDFLDGPYEQIGTSLPGANGPLSIAGSGSMQPGAALTVSVQNALGNSPLFLAIGFQVGAIPLLGGTLWPAPFAVLPPAPTGADGGYSLSAKTPPVLASGESLIFQAWVVDPAAPHGAAATPGLIATVP